MAQQTEDYLKYAVLATPYVTATSLLYLLGYWGTFKINIFSYISLSDILKLALIPSLVLVICVAVTSAITYFLEKYKHTKGVLKPPTPNVDLVVNSIISGAGILVLIFVAGPHKWLWAGLIGGALITRALERLEILKRLIVDNNLRFVTALMVTIPLTCAYGFGRLRAQPILTGEKTTLIDTKLFREHGSESLAKKRLLEHEKLKILGIAGDYVFFLTVDNSRVYVVKFSDLHFLEYNPWE